MKSGFAILFLAILLPNSSGPAPGSRGPCKRSKLFTAQGIVAWSTPSNAQGFFYKSGLAIDADGVFRAYRKSEVLLHISGKATNRELARTAGTMRESPGPHDLSLVEVRLSGHGSWEAAYILEKMGKQWLTEAVSASEG